MGWVSLAINNIKLIRLIAQNKNKMIYVSVQPDITYFHWQVELYLFNFLQVGIKPEDIYVVFLYNGSMPSERGLELQKKNPSVNFFFTKDDRSDKSYVPSIKPWGMRKFIESDFNLIRKQIFYHDSDVIFREKINESLFDNKTIAYMSDTVSYIGYNYVKSKGERQLKKMADIVGISVDVIKNRQLSSGGAQYILTNTTPTYWQKVYEDSNKLYRLMDRESKSSFTGAYPIQKWCAEMWATLWNLWYFGGRTEVHKELDFCFATAPISDWNKVKILHNAGITESDKHKMFFKGAYIDKFPYNEDLSFVQPEYCSYKYAENIESYRNFLKKK